MFKRLLFFFIQWTWGLPQNLAGLFIYLAQDQDHRGMRYECAYVAKWKKPRSMSLGMYIFLGRGAGERILRHEYGHSMQSLILGPLYLIAVGIPSLIWCNCKPVAASWQSGSCSYYSVYPESWADSLGHALEVESKSGSKATGGSDPLLGKLSRTAKSGSKVTGGFDPKFRE